MSLDAGGSFAEVSNYDGSWALSSESLDGLDLHFENCAVTLKKKKKNTTIRMNRVITISKNIIIYRETYLHTVLVSTCYTIA